MNKKYTKIQVSLQVLVMLRQNHLSKVVWNQVKVQSELKIRNRQSSKMMYSLTRLLVIVKLVVLWKVNI